MVVHDDKDIHVALDNITTMAIDQRIHTQTAAITSTWEAIERSPWNDHAVVGETFPNYSQSTLEYTEKERDIVITKRVEKRIIWNKTQWNTTI